MLVSHGFETTTKKKEKYFIIYIEALFIIRSAKCMIFIKLEHAMPITPHANGEPLLQQSSLILLSQFATILLVVWSANGDGSALTFKAGSNLLNDDTCRCVCAGNCVIYTGLMSKVRII